MAVVIFSKERRLAQPLVRRGRAVRYTEDLIFYS
jgi:hypothetical protein